MYTIGQVAKMFDLPIPRFDTTINKDFSRNSYGNPVFVNSVKTKLRPCE